MGGEQRAMSMMRRGVPTLCGSTAASRPRASRLKRLLCAVLPVFAVTLALAGSASAATGHKFLGELNEAPEGTALTSAEAVTIDAASGDIFVAAGEEGVDVFESSGKFKTQFGVGILEGETTGIAVDPSGRVYVADLGTNTVDVFKPTGPKSYELLSTWSGAATPATTFAELRGIAVDNSTSSTKGEVYVADSGSSAVDVFEPQPESKAEPGVVTTLKGKPEFEEVGGVAVSPATGKVYVADTKAGETGIVEVFSAAHVFETKLSGKGAPTSGLGPLGAIGVEPSTGDVYVADTEVGALDQLNAAGEWIGWVRAGPGGRDLSPSGVAVSTSGKLYVAARSVDIFGPSTTVPDVKTGTGKSSKTKPVVVTLTGTINPLGKKAKYHFEYGPPGEFTASTKVEEVEGPAELKVSAQVQGLKPGTAYDFRLVAENEEGVPNYGQSAEFITAEAVAGVETLPASGIEATAATLHGSLEPQSFPTKYYFEWGETALYGHNSPVPFGETSASTAVPVETKLTGLKPGVTYHYRLVASNQFGISYGGDAQFPTVGPGITTEPAVPVSPNEETLSTKINPNKLKTKVHFQWGETAGYGEVTATEKLGEFPQAVKATVKGLKLATTYHFRVVVEVENEKAEVISTSFGPDQQFTSRLIESESATALSSETALLKADLNPTGGETPKTVSCQFEWGTSPAYTASVPCEPASSTTATVFSGHVTGLAANTTYHYRVTATIGAEHGSGVDQTFTTPAASIAFKLPDGRAYEMVSPPNKQGGYIEPLTGHGGAIQASADGNALAFVVDGPIVEDVEGNRSPESQQVLSTRGSTTWSSQEIVPPHENAGGLRPGEPDDEYLIFSQDLALGMVRPFAGGLTPYAEPPLSPPAAEAERKPCPESTNERPCQEKTLYLRNDKPIAPTEAEESLYNEAQQSGETLAKEHGEAGGKPGYLPLVTAANTPPGTKFGGEILGKGRLAQHWKFLTATPDLTHVLLTSQMPLASEPPSAPGLYEWAGGKLQLVSILPNGEAAPTPRLGFEFKNAGANFRHAISNNGSRVVWTNNEGAEGLGHLYMRDTVQGKTIQLDVPGPGLAKPAIGEASFQVASADASKVFFTDTQRLTEESSAGPGKPDLYECEVTEAGCKLQDLTVPAAESASVEGVVLGASDEGTYLYFVAAGALVPEATPGAHNLYMLHFDGSKWATTFIAVLSSEDSPDWFDANKFSTRLVDMTAAVSPHGQYLAFMSNMSLTGYNNVDVREETGKHKDEEVFLYDGLHKHLNCASCNPSGARPHGVLDTELAGEGSGLRVDRPGVWSDTSNAGIAHWLAGSIPGWTALLPTTSIYQSRYLNDAGRLFFTSADPLVGGMAVTSRNETIQGNPTQVGVENVYEYKPNEVAECANPLGCVGLISSGTSEKESAFLDASATGEDVFFLTAAPLLPQDEDGSYDVYDARVCGESGCLPTPTKPPAPCASIAECRGPSSSPPTFAPAPSFSGPGNTLHKVPSGETLPIKVTKRPLTNAQKLALALKSCRKLAHKTRAQKKKRAKCEAVAKRKYGAKKAKHARRAR